MSQPTATIRYQPSYWNRVCQATIPPGWVIYPHDGSPKFGGELTADQAVELAERHGYKAEVER